MSQPTPPLPPILPISDTQIGVAGDPASGEEEVNQGRGEWGNTLLSYLFAAALALVAIYYQIQPPDNLPLSFNILSLALLFATSTSLIGFSLRPKYNTVAQVLEKIGVLFATLTVFMAIEITLPWSLKWIVWILCFISLCFQALSHT